MNRGPKLNKLEELKYRKFINFQDWTLKPSPEMLVVSEEIRLKLKKRKQ
nr:hypothetical protein [Candidatus Mycoplasma haematolamae]